MALLNLEEIHITYGSRHLLDGVSMIVDEGDRIGMVGANGSGKSTLLRLLAAAETPDDGKRSQLRGLRIGYLEQEPVLDPKLSIRTAARLGMQDRDQVLAELNQLHHAMAQEGTSAEALERLLRQQAALEDRLDALGGHDIEHRVEALIHALGLPDPEALCGQLSGGERRRTALARLLLSSPGLLLLDEPTNHLDTEVIAWLEDHLLQSRAALVLVTHDRYFLDRIVNRIVEVDNGKLYQYQGNYVDFLSARTNRLARDQKSESTRQNLLRRETEWMRRGPPARTSKSKARIQSYHALRAAAPEAPQGELSFQIPCEKRLGDRVLVLTGVCKAYGDKSVLQGLDLEIGRGERLGIIGPNGAGKTSLLRICMQQLATDAGTVKVGPTVKFSYIDQARSDLDPDKSVVDEVAAGNPYIMVGGHGIKVESYLERFLFPSRLLHTRVGDLSGGERNRILIAKLLAVGGNVLILDEPTNDLDLMTLRVLEEALIAFPGSALIVSHDRWFLDRVATRVLHLHSDCSYRLHAGDVSGLLEILATEAKAASRAQSRQNSAAARSSTKVARERKLSSKEKRELESLPDRISQVETELAILDVELAQPNLYASDRSKTEELSERRRVTAGRLQELYQRWEKLETLAN